MRPPRAGLGCRTRAAIHADATFFGSKRSAPAALAALLQGSGRGAFTEDPSPLLH